MIDYKEFIKYCKKVLDNHHFGHISDEIIDNIVKNNKLNENSSDNDIKNFIDIIESSISIIAGRNKAKEVCKEIRAKSNEFKEFRGDMFGSEEKGKDVVKMLEVGKVIEIGQGYGKVNAKEETEDIDRSKKDNIDIEKNLPEDNTNIEIETENKIENKIENNLDYVDNKILILLEYDNTIDDILNKLDIEEISLADKIIDLDQKEFIALDGKNWILTQKGKDIINIRRNTLTKLKLDYLHGNVTKEEFVNRSKELEYLIDKRKEIEEKNKFSDIKKPEIDKNEKEEIKQEQEQIKPEIDKIAKDEIKKDEIKKKEEKKALDKLEDKIICPKCNTENKVGNRFCTKCGYSLN